MIELLHIEGYHEYDGGRSAHLSLVPSADLQRLAANDRLRFRHEAGFVSCYCEDDRELVTERDHLCFWLTPTHDDFFYYSDYAPELRFNIPRFLWTTPTVEGDRVVLQTEALEDPVPPQFHRQGDPVPDNALGLVAIPCDQLEEAKTFRVPFGTRKTFWEYRIQASEPADQIQFLIEDREEEWTFESAGRVDEAVLFRSSQPIPYQKKSLQPAHPDLEAGG